MVDIVEFHHTPELTASSSALVAMVNLIDALCCLRGMGYVYDENAPVRPPRSSGLEFAGKPFPRIDELDIARFTFELDAGAEEIRPLVSVVFQPQ